MLNKPSPLLTHMSSTSSPSFNQTLQFITSAKLVELEKQRAAFQSHAEVIDEANALGRSSVERGERLLAAVRSAPVAGAASSTLTFAGGVNLYNLEAFLHQAKWDDSISPDKIARWGDALERHLRQGVASPSLRTAVHRVGRERGRGLARNG